MGYWSNSIRGLLHAHEAGALQRGAVVKGATFSWTLPPGPPLTPEQRERVQAALHLVPKIVRQQLRRRPGARRYSDELPSVVYEGLVWAAQKFDPARGSNWLTYAFFGGEIRLRAWLLALERREPAAWLDAPLGSDSDGPTLLERIPCPQPGPDAAVLAAQVLRAVDRLPERQRAGIRRLLDERSLADVGAEMGRSVEAVRKWEMSGLERLREELGLAPRRKRADPPPLDARERLLSALRERPRTAAELRAITGMSKTAVLENLRAAGATFEPPSTWALDSTHRAVYK